MEAKPPRRTRERILELSLKLFNEIGEPNVTTTTIAEEMEISPGNLYYHFRNKDDIINSIFAQFEQQIERRLRFPEDHRPTIDETWSYLQYMADFMWTYRFLYRDLNDLLARNRTLETHFKQIISHKVRFAREMCELLAADGELVATPAEIEVIATNMAVIATYWLSYQYVMHPRKYNDQDAIREELHQVSMHVISVIAPYLRGRSRQIFDDLVSGKLPKREFHDYLPPARRFAAQGHEAMNSVCVYCGSANGAKPVYADAARAFGRALANAGLTLVYGGGRVGLMGVIADEVIASGGRAIGVITELLYDKEVGHTGLTELHVVPDMHHRKKMMAELADAFVAMPGGAGTLEEFFEVYTWAQLGYHRKPVALYNVDAFYQPLIALLEHTVDEGFMQRTYFDALCIDAAPDALIDQLVRYRPPARDKWTFVSTQEA